MSPCLFLSLKVYIIGLGIAWKSTLNSWGVPFEAKEEEEEEEEGRKGGG